MLYFSSERHFKLVYLLAPPRQIIATSYVFANDSIVNGSHLAADSTFIEKRRRGLTRFSNALVRHPVLSQEQLVIMFLTVPTVSSYHIVDNMWLNSC